ncbi:hypothetical protein ONZ51_g987 [Trametes cubensis]|uniref:Uncharacterized protein n=1 Tax=Trametes cubensis TaxID=1111947 RepID=A0AAD7XG74_9APHY|nr:hypothetical protein ONZ51_g987 [Trametes cubensis]
MSAEHLSPAIRATAQQPAEPTSDTTEVSRCLYPGAIFRGSQKSGRKRYDANMTIVDVDLASSRFSGHLCIHGLTKGWPELTTYFDAEIIGPHYGFLTRKWGATETEDMVHWKRFPAFKRVQDELEDPDLTRKDAVGGGMVFMRWKEKYVVSDRGTQDIEGASYAGEFSDIRPKWTTMLMGTSFNDTSIPSYRLLLYLYRLEPAAGKIWCRYGWCLWQRIAQRLLLPQAL